MNDNRFRLSPEGELTINQAAEFRDALLEAFRDTDRIEIDMANVEKLDLSILQILCSAHKSANRQGKILSIVTPHAPVLAESRKTAGFIFHKGCGDRVKECLWTGGWKNE